MIPEALERIEQVVGATCRLVADNGYWVSNEFQSSDTTTFHITPDAFIMGVNGYKLLNFRSMYSIRFPLPASH